VKKVKLNKDFNTGDFKIGASILKQLLWYFTDVFFFRTKIIPFSTVLVAILKLFGAKIGKEVRIKPGFYVKYPWKLEVGDNSWLADCYLENLDWIKIGKNCCLSQQSKLITGNHNYKKTSFDLMVAPIIIEDGAWIGAGSQIGPGVHVKSHAVLTLGSVTTKTLDENGIYQGNPAIKIKNREIE
jgi:putative colanic acid biosynthesis acetyltransferase WcaF